MCDKRCVLAAAAAQNLSQRWGSDERGATWVSRYGLIGKRVVDFLLVLIELFSLCVRLRRYMSDYRFKIGDFAPTGAG